MADKSFAEQVATVNTALQAIETRVASGEGDDEGRSVSGSLTARRSAAHETPSFSARRRP